MADEAKERNGVAAEENDTGNDALAEEDEERND
jgi:hypothetical protein